MSRGFFPSLALLLTASLWLSGCLAPLKPPKQPMPVWVLDGETAARSSISAQALQPTEHLSTTPCALVLLPGSFDHPKAFARHGFDQALKARYPELRIVAVDAHMGYYRHRSVVQRLQEDVVGPLKDQGYRVWMAGISLGGLGSLLYAQQSGEPTLAVDGLIVMAPFLGHDALIEELLDAGGAMTWVPPDPLPEIEGRGTVGYALWPWLADWYRERQDNGRSAPEIVLAYGLKDSFAPAGELLVELLPEEHVFTHPGGHDWKTWSPLWQDIVQAGLLDGCTPPKE